MKLITSNLGTAAVRVSNDEVAPPRGFLHQDIVNFIAGRYAFSVRPPNLGQMQVIQSMVFQNGAITLDEERIAVMSLALVIDGDIAYAATTELADKVLNDLISNLEQVFGFRYSTAKQ